MRLGQQGVHGGERVPAGVVRHLPGVVLHVEVAVGPAQPVPDPRDVTQQAHRRDHGGQPRTPAVLPAHDRDQRDESDHDDERGAGRPGETGHDAEQAGGEPVPPEQGEQRPRGERGEQGLGVAHRLHERVRQDRPEPGQQHAGPAITQVGADREQSPGRRRTGQPGDGDAGTARAARKDRIEQRGQARKDREERQVGDGQAAVGLQRDDLVIPVCDDPGIVDGVVPSEQAQQAPVLLGGEQPEHGHTHDPQPEVQADGAPGGADGDIGDRGLFRCRRAGPGRRAEIQHGGLIRSGHRAAPRCETVSGAEVY